MGTIQRAAGREAEQGFVLVGLIVAIFLILLALSVAAPRVARGLRREREVESIHRGDQYVRAIQVYFRKNGHYPGSIEQLEKSNNIRYLRQRYVDPMTGKADWRLIHVGEAKTTVKGFFGKPLTGVPGVGGLGSAAGMVANGAPGSTVGSSPSGSSFGSSSFGASGSGSTSSSFGSSGASSFGSSSPTSSSTSGSPAGTTPGSTGSTGIGSQSATTFSGTGAPIMGVGSSAKGESITVLNEQTTYPTWEFIYDPRIEQMKAKASLLGGGPSTASGSTSATTFGSNGPGGTTTPGSSGSSSFGTSSFGSSSFGSSGASNPSTSTSPAPSSNTPQ